jgi:hypothetical protein
LDDKSRQAHWQRSVALLAEVRKLVPASYAFRDNDYLAQYGLFLFHYEFALALDSLGLIFEEIEETETVPSQAWKHLAQAAEHMGLADKQLFYKNFLDQSVTGDRHNAHLPRENADAVLSGKQVPSQIANAVLSGKQVPAQEIADAVRSAVRSGNKVLAILLQRQSSGMGLIEAKQFVEEIERRAGMN